MFFYRVSDFNFQNVQEIEAKSLIDAARKYLGTKNVRRMKEYEFGYIKWHCVVFKMQKGDKHQITYAEGYYTVI